MVKFKPIPLNKRFLASDTGHIYDSYKQEYLEEYEINSGYLAITKGQKVFQGETLVHRLVSYAWHENDDPENKVQVNHINANRHDNRPCNLEWCTVSYNIRDALVRNPDLTENARKKLKEVVTKAILVYDAKTDEFVKEFDRVKYAGTWLQETKGASKTTAAHISDCLSGRRATCLGYTYKYKNPEQANRAKYKDSKKHTANLKAKHNKLIKPVYQYTYAGELVKEYQNIFKVVEENDSFNYQALQKAVTGRDTKHRHHYARFSWFYEPQTVESILEFNK